MVYVSRLCNGFVFIGGVMVCVSQWSNVCVPRGVKVCVPLWCNGLCFAVV